MASRSIRPRATAEEEKVCYQIREYLENVSFVTSRTRSVFSCQCGHATYSQAKNCWRIQHVQRQSGQVERKGKPTLVAELYHSGRESLSPTKGSYKRSRPLPPVELVESLLMCQELKSWVEKCKQKIEGTPEGEERLDRKVAQIDNLSFRIKDQFGEVINFAVFLSMLHREEDGPQLFGQILGQEDEPELWKMKEYRGWTVRSMGDSTMGSGRRSSTGTTTSSLSSFRVSSILESVGSTMVPNSKNDNNNKRVAGDVPVSEPTPKPKRQKMEHSKPLGVDSLSSLPHAFTSNVRRGVAQLGSPTTARPPALESSSESDHTTDDEGHEKQRIPVGRNSQMTSSSIQADLEEAAVKHVSEGQMECSASIVTDASPTRDVSSCEEREAEEHEQDAHTGIRLSEATSMLMECNASVATERTSPVVANPLDASPGQGAARSDVKPLEEQRDASCQEQLPEMMNKQHATTVTNSSSSSFLQPRSRRGQRFEQGLSSIDAVVAGGSCTLLSSEHDASSMPLSEPMDHEKIEMRNEAKKSGAVVFEVSDGLCSFLPSDDAILPLHDQSDNPSSRQESFDHASSKPIAGLSALEVKRLTEPEVSFASPLQPMKPHHAEDKENEMTDEGNGNQPTGKEQVDKEESNTRESSDQAGSGPKASHGSEQQRNQQQPFGTEAIATGQPNYETQPGSRAAQGTLPPPSAAAKQTTSLRRSKRPHRSKVDADFVDHRPTRSNKEGGGHRQRKPKVTFAEEENEFFPHEQVQDEPSNKLNTRSRRRGDKQGDIPPQTAGDSSRRPTRPRRSRNPTESENGMGGPLAPASEEEQDSAKKTTRPRRIRTQIERYTDARSEKIEEMASSPVKDEDSGNRVTRSRRAKSPHDEMSSSTAAEEEEEEPSSSRSVRSRRTRAPVERYSDTPSGGSQTCLVRIKLIGEEFVNPLEAVIGSEGIPSLRRDPNPSSSKSGNTYSLRARRAQSYHEGDDDIIMEEQQPAAADGGIGTDDSDDDDSPILVVTPFIMNRKNFLRVENLVKNYEEACYKRHGTCFSLKNGKDISAKTSIESLQKELETLDRKHPMEEEAEDEDILAEQQLHNKTLRVMQGRRSQERSVRMKEKEQAEHMANLLLQKEWTNKKKAPTVEEIEWEEIVNRPILNSEARTVRGKRVGGKESCPCATTSTRKRDETTPPCRLCEDITTTFESAGGPVPVKGMMPLFRPIDTDSPEFLERDGDVDRSLEEAEKTDDSDEKKASRVSKRMKFDPRRRRETTKKLSELRYSMEFIEQYNYGLLPKIISGS